MFSKSYINYIAYKDTASKTVKLEQVIQQPTFAEIHEIYTIDSITFRINPPSNEFADRRIQEKFRDINFFLLSEPLLGQTTRFTYFLQARTSL
ncbi:hypothetical protein [Algoriphagus boritolerans]|uniref:hypothetical protein n=1 Tax=Algoriphagus boritolerans TaxID=308111 RepID=UPI000A6BEFDC